MSKNRIWIVLVIVALAFLSVVGIQTFANSKATEEHPQVAPPVITQEKQEEKEVSLSKKPDESQIESKDVESEDIGTLAKDLEKWGEPTHKPVIHESMKLDFGKEKK